MGGFSLNRNSAGSVSMPCPRCGARKSTVVDSRPRDDGVTRRRRECMNCQHRFTSFESMIDPANLEVGLNETLKKRLQMLETTVKNLVKDLTDG